MRTLHLLLDLLLVPSAFSRSGRQLWVKPQLVTPPTDLPCEAPVRRAEVKFPDKLLAGSVNQPQMYSGYINVTSKDYLFYWFVEAETGAADAPTIVWSNGGPGCSSMEGATTEIGALVLFNVKLTGHSGYKGKLSRNSYAWNQKANILFVDQPRYVGFSTGTGPYVTTSQQAGVDMVKFLQGWRSAFPEKAQSDFILASESYGGHYVPAWTRAILDHNARVHAADQIRIAGIAIGNGVIDEKLQDSSALAAWAGLQNLVTGEGVPLTEVTTREMIAQTLGYSPNFYDYRLEDLGDCCGCFSYNYTPWARWMMQEGVRKALHVCGKAGSAAFDDCAGGCISFPSPFDPQETTLQSREILQEALTLDIPVLLFYGMQDSTCNYVGGYTVASSLDWPGAAVWAKTPAEPLIVAGAATGKIQAAHGLTWIQIEDAGHMASVDNPAAAHFVIDKLLRDVDERKRAPVIMQKSEFASKMGDLYSPATSSWLFLAGSIFSMVLLFLAYSCGRRATIEEKSLRALVPLSDEEPLNSATCQRDFLRM